MISNLLKLIGYDTPDKIIGFLVSGMMVLPTLFFLGGERNAAAVTMLILINVLLVYGVRTRELESLHEKSEALERKFVERRRKPRNGDSG